MLRYRLVVPCLVLTLVFTADAQQSQPAAKDQFGDPLPPGAIARLGTTRWRHDAAVAFSAFLPDGKAVITVGDDLTIRIWEFPSGKEKRRITLGVVQEPASHYPAAALSPDGKTLAVYNYEPGSDKAVFRLHDLVGDKKLPELTATAGGGVYSLTFSPDGKQLATANGGTVHIWDWANGKFIFRFKGGNGLCYAPDGKSLAVFADMSLKIVDPSTGKELRSLFQQERPPGFGGGGTTGSTGSIQPIVLRSAVFSPDSKTLAFSTTDSVITFVEAATGKEIRKLNVEPRSAKVALLFSKDGKKLFRHLSDYQVSPIVQEWDVDSGTLRRTLPDVQGSWHRNYAVTPLVVARWQHASTVQPSTGCAIHRSADRQGDRRGRSYRATPGAPIHI